MNALPAYDGRYIKTKIRTYDDKVYTKNHGKKKKKKKKKKN